ncbi:putative FBD-associated F-box protein At3g50710 [Bidens hawaiensis]|uniref:putative FBD-associated F-box protein At3g50710 n=1 Tax=Bidens hawaiensis TaxID=980011 RepID=UPI00404A4655
MVKADLISRLHDALLIQILSLLPLPYAQRTRILSKRWKNLWTLLPVLHLVMPFCWTAEEINRFHDLVDQALDLRGNMPIQRFYLYCSKNCSYDRVSGWLRKVVQCKTLLGFVSDLPLCMLFPCLKTVNLISIVYCCNKCFKNLICGCPVLEELFVERQLLNGLFDNMDTFESLSQFYGVYIPTFPKVVKFVIEVKASLGWRVLLVLLNKMPNLEHITFSDISLRGFYPGTHARALNESWNPPAEVPACLRCKMKEIIIDNQETVSPEQFELIRYLLNSADKLESLTMNARTINTKMREQTFLFLDLYN